MSLRKVLGLDEIHQELDLLIKCDFRDIQKKFAGLKDKYLVTLNQLTPKTKIKKNSKTPSTYFSTPKMMAKRKLKLTPQKTLSSSKSSRKNSDNSSIDPENIFGRPIKVNLKEIFQDYLSSSDESKGYNNP
jgi:hypothetical protein